MWFGAALGLSAVTAVTASAPASQSPLDVCRAGFLVPLAAAALAAAITAFSLRSPTPHEVPVAG
ncbi:hypothetical protein [Streptomyces sp. IBSBF 2435]|uniref:hypothetical protein n=1 Tax=Streptomyces sp. IBSBF 2435 TaxID=2903531 RepID=UPI002FDBCB73